MYPSRAELLVMLGLGVALGSAMTYQKMARKYNKLARDYNMIVERNRISQRIFREMLPQLPDDYTFSEQAQIDVASWNLFVDNDL